MGTAAAVAGDRIVGTCTHHLNLLLVPAGPVPFAAPVTLGVHPTVLIAGRQAVVVGSSGTNVAPHPVVDPTPTQVGVVLAGSPTVLVGGLPLARTGSAATCCLVAPGTVVGSAATVMVA